MAKVQAKLMGAGNRWSGYYKHKRIKAGEIFEMKEVDDELFYLEFDDNGKAKGRKKFPIFDVHPETGKSVKTGKTEERQCNWVAKVGTVKEKKVDPKSVAAVLSGKHPGVANPVAPKDDE